MYPKLSQKIQEMDMVNKAGKYQQAELRKRWRNHLRCKSLKKNLKRDC